MQVRNTNYYADQVAARYPLLPRLVVRALCRWMMCRLFALVSQGEEILLTSPAHKLRLKIYHRNLDVSQANQRNRRKRWALVQRREQRAREYRLRQLRTHFGLSDKDPLTDFDEQA